MGTLILSSVLVTILLVFSTDISSVLVTILLVFSIDITSQSKGFYHLIQRLGNFCLVFRDQNQIISVCMVTSRSTGIT